VRTRTLPIRFPITSPRIGTHNLGSSRNSERKNGHSFLDSDLAENRAPSGPPQRPQVTKLIELKYG
jgi:hypothetical protein